MKVTEVVEVDHKLYIGEGRYHAIGIALIDYAEGRGELIKVLQEFENDTDWTYLGFSLSWLNKDFDGKKFEEENPEYFI